MADGKWSARKIAMSQQSRQQGMGGVPTGQGLTMQQQQQGDGYLYREMGSVRSEQPQPPGTGVEMLLHEEPYNAERIMEVNSTGRYAKLNVLLGKGAYKVVYKGIDREEGYEVAWNTAQVCFIYYGASQLNIISPPFDRPPRLNLWN